MTTLTILWHSRTGASAALAKAAAQAARATEVGAVQLIDVARIDAATMLATDGYLFVGPENLGALSGAMKEALDQLYYPLLGQVEGRPYGHIIAAGSDGAGAAAQLARIVTGWRLRAVMPPRIVNMDAQTPEAIAAPKIVPQTALDQAAEAGALLGSGLAMGVF